MFRTAFDTNKYSLANLKNTPANICLRFGQLRNTFSKLSVLRFKTSRWCENQEFVRSHKNAPRTWTYDLSIRLMKISIAPLTKRLHTCSCLFCSLNFLMPSMVERSHPDSSLQWMLPKFSWNCLRNFTTRLYVCAISSSGLFQPYFKQSPMMAPVAARQTCHCLEMPPPKPVAIFGTRLVSIFKACFATAKSVLSAQLYPLLK